MYRNVLRGQRSTSEQLLSAKELVIMFPVTEDGGVSDWVDETELAPNWEIGDGREESHSLYPSLHQIKYKANVAAWSCTFVLAYAQHKCVKRPPPREGYI